MQVQKIFEGSLLGYSCLFFVNLLSRYFARLFPKSRTAQMQLKGKHRTFWYTSLYKVSALLCLSLDVEFGQEAFRILVKQNHKKQEKKVAKASRTPPVFGLLGLGCILEKWTKWTDDTGKVGIFEPLEGAQFSAAFDPRAQDCSESCKQKGSLTGMIY
jgi:hypothetical protein